MIKASKQLIDLCNKFENEIINRSKIAREKANIPTEKTKIPNYRELLLTKTFDKFSRCTCDQPNHQHSSKKSSNCKKHQNSDGSSSSEESSQNSSYDSDSDISDSSSNLSQSSGKKSNHSSKDQSNTKTEKPIKEDKFEDIRSMEIHRKQNHPERLHPDLSFNEPDQVDYTFFNYL